MITGAQGVIGRAAAAHFSDRPTRRFTASRAGPSKGWRTSCRSPPICWTPQTRAGSSAGLKDVTHVVFAAYVEKDTPTERSAVNVALLRNLMDAVEAASPDLRHVTHVPGRQGVRGGPRAVQDPGARGRPAADAAELLLRPGGPPARGGSTGKRWSFSILRPEAVCGYAVGNPMNLTMVIAVYAAISKELGLPLRFPGTLAAYQALYQVTCADILASAAAWAGETDAAANEIFNITNGDYFRWQFLWPRIARMFQMEVAEPVPMPLAVYMADKGPLWEEMTRKYSLQTDPYEQVVRWQFGDFIFNSGFDNISSTIKARRAGFHDCIDTEEMFSDFFNDLRQQHVIPALR